MIFFESDADEVLLHFLLDEYTSKGDFDHKRGKGNVLKWIFEKENVVGLVDRDKDSFQYRMYYEKFKEIDFSEHYKYTLYELPNGNKIVELDPKLEDWIMRVSNIANIRIESLGLSREVSRFKEQVNLNPMKLEKLLAEIADSEHLKKLKQVLLDCLNVI